MILITLIASVIWILVGGYVKAIAFSLQFSERFFRRYVDVMSEEYKVSYTEYQR